MEAKGDQPGPVVWLTACVHGDEVGGIVVVQEIFKRFKKKPLKRGELYAFPLMNPVGFETISRHIGFSKEDLNRSFPGNPNGSLAERIADRIFSKIMDTHPTLVLDLHNDWIQSIPYVLIDPSFEGIKQEVQEQTIQFARESGFVMIKERGDGSTSRENEKTLSGSLLRVGSPAFTLELGESYVVNERNVEYGVNSIWKILASLGMTEREPGSTDYPAPNIVREEMLDYSDKPTATTSGIIRYFVKPGQVVRRGDRIARIYNVFGKLQETIEAVGDGLVLGHSDTSVALPGMPVAAFGLLNKDRL